MSFDGGGKSYWWIQIVKELSADEPESAIEVTTLGLFSDELLHSQPCEALLVELAKVDAAAVMKNVGQVVLDNQVGWRFSVGAHRSLIESLRTDVVTGWIRQYGVEAARQVAAHLPKPYLEKDGTPTVPKSTEFVLERRCPGVS